MTHSPRSTDQSTPLLRVTQEPHLNYARPQSPPRSGGIFRWFAGLLATGGVSGTQGYYSVTNLVAKSMLTGGLFGAGSIACGAACLYCGYRVYLAIKYRNVQPIVPVENIAASKANVAMLRMVNTRLNGLLNDTQIIDLEEGVADINLHESIGRQLHELEQMLPLLRGEIAELQATIQGALAGRSVSSPGAGGLDSPSVDSSFERGLLGKLDALSKKVGKDQSSRNASRLSSTTSSPAGTSSYSFAAVSPAASPVVRTSPAARRITFGSVNDGGTPMSPAAGDSQEERK